MTTVKNLDSFSFRNEYGWMDAMKGERWKETIKQLKKEYESQFENPLVKNTVKQIQEELSSAPSYTTPVKIDSVEYEMRGSQTLAWKFIGADPDDVFYAADIDVDGKTVWSVEDRSNGSEQYTLGCYTRDKHRWNYDKPVGSFVAILGSRCYAIEVENYLWYKRVISVNAKTGADRRVELELEDPQWNLQFFKGSNHCLFITANNAGVQRLWYVTSQGKVKELTGEGEAFVPVGFLQGSTNPCYFERKTGSTSYTPVNCEFHCKQQTPEWMDPILHICCTRNLGYRSLWDTKTNKLLLTVLGNVDYDSLCSWKGKTASITIQEPGSYRQELSAYLAKETLCEYAKKRYFKTTSADGTSVPYILVSSCKPKHLLCIVYGAYGVPSRLGVDRWKPLLDRGWGLCLCLVRGGGDHTDGWAEAARRENKVKSVEDFESCLRAARKKFHVAANQTFLYGRSAGGYTVGATLARNASGSLFQGVYTEVPYVDVLNTTSNPSLPLTRLEYNEFGDPHRLPNAKTLLALSPIDSLPSTGAPSIFVLTRTAENDKEVYAYESVKWITVLQDLQKQYGGKPKLLAMKDKEGHFAPPASVLEERAKDLALLHFSTFLDKKSHQEIYQMANTRKNNVASRKNRKSRKNNVASRKRNNVTMGGKRRAGRKGSKGRKGGKTRKH
jgi:hypothetical protein